MQSSERAFEHKRSKINLVLLNFMADERQVELSSPVFFSVEFFKHSGNQHFSLCLQEFR